MEIYPITTRRNRHVILNHPHARPISSTHELARGVSTYMYVLRTCTCCVFPFKFELKCLMLVYMYLKNHEIMAQ